MTSGYRFYTLKLLRNCSMSCREHLRRLHNQVRQMIEAVNGQLAEQFDIQTNHAHTLSIYINRLLGLHIKALAFPN